MKMSEFAKLNNQQTATIVGAVDRSAAKNAAVTARAVDSAVKKSTDENRAFTARAVDAGTKKVSDKIDATSAETRDYIGEEHKRTREEIDRAARKMLGNHVGALEIIIGLIAGIIAGVAMYFMESNVIVKPTAYDAVGNVLSYGTDVFMLSILSVVLAAFVFFCVTTTVHWFRTRKY